MRGSDEQSGSLFSFIDLEARVPQRHPLRKIRQIVNEALAALDGDFSQLYACDGRPSIAPEKLLRASLLQAFFSVRSERQLTEQLDYNLMFRWFVGLGIDDAVWDATVFTKNRDRLLDAEVAAKFMAAVLAHAQVKPLLSSEHFSVDGTLVEAWEIETKEITVSRTFRDFDDLWSTSTLGTNVRAMIASMSVDEIELLKSRVCAQVSVETSVVSPAVRARTPSKVSS